jgi:hypothetical protein
MKHDLFSDSDDFVEQTWAREIDKRFSFYAIFWSEFIGKNRAGAKPDQMLKGYGLRFPGAMMKEKQEFILGQYRRICHAHYALFCHLAGAHHELSRLRRARARPQDPMKSFVYFETLGNLYSRMASALEILVHLWGCFYELRNEAAYKPRTFLKVTQRQFEKDLESYHLMRSYKELLKQVVHYQRAISYLQRYTTTVQDSRAYIPKTCKKRYPFFQNFEELVECKQKATEDLEALEIFINCLHSEYLRNMKDWLANRSISVKYLQQPRTSLFEPTESKESNRLEIVQSAEPGKIQESEAPAGEPSSTLEKAVSVSGVTLPK